MNRSLIAAACVLAGLILPILPAAAQEDTRYSGDSLLLGAGARAQGMGSAYVAISDDATAVYWNPAGLSQLGRPELHFQHAEQIGGTVNHDVITVAMPLASTVLGVGLMRLGVDDVKEALLEDPGQPPGPGNRPVVSRVVGASDYSIHLSAGRWIREDVSLGASLKLLWRNLSAGDGSGYGLDLSVLYRPRPDVTVGGVLRNLPRTTITYGSGVKDRIPPSLLIGSAYTRPLPSLEGVAKLSASVHLGEERSGVEDVEGVHLGAEFVYRDRVAFRLGAEGDHFTAGAGVRVRDRFGLDLAFLQNGQLDNTFRISASAYF